MAIGLIENSMLHGVFDVFQYVPHYIQMRLLWCLHEMAHHSNCIIQIWPCDGHVNQIIYYEFIHSNVLHKFTSIDTQFHIF
jgi:hypothetical protein